MKPAPHIETGGSVGAYREIKVENFVPATTSGRNRGVAARPIPGQGFSMTSTPRSAAASRSIQAFRRAVEAIRRSLGRRSCSIRWIWQPRRETIVGNGVRNNAIYSGIDGIHLQDQAITESMGPIVDHTFEHLAPSDRMITHTRRRLLMAARAPE